MSIRIRKTAKGLSIRTTGKDAQLLLEHLGGPVGASAQSAPLQDGAPRTGAVATIVNVRVRTKAQGA